LEGIVETGREGLGIKVGGGWGRLGVLSFELMVSGKRVGPAPVRLTALYAVVRFSCGT